MRTKMLARCRSTAAIWLTITILFLFCYYFLSLSPGRTISTQAFLGPPLNYTHGPITDPNLPFGTSIPKPPGSNYTRTLVVGHRTEESIAWISETLPDLHVAAYVVDDLNAPLHTPRNKGREATVYLSYIIDHYDNLPDIVLFFHSGRYAWHNSVFHDRDSAAMIQAMRDDHVAREGYFNVRCEHNPGCPDWLHLDRAEVDFDRVFKPEERAFTPQVWKEIWGTTARVPTTLSQPCCAQFAVTRERIRLNPLTTYVHIRDWLLQTHLVSDDSGRVMEYSWQFLFNRLYEHCPPINRCSCAGYGVCFGSEKKTRYWLDLVYEREHGEHDLKKLKEGEEKAKAIIAAGSHEDLARQREEKEHEYEEKIKALTDRIGIMKDEAVERGKDENNIAIERGRNVRQIG